MLILIMDLIDTVQFKKGDTWTYKRWQWRTISRAVMVRLFRTIQLVTCLAAGQLPTPQLS